MPDQTNTQTDAATQTANAQTTQQTTSTVALSVLEYNQLVAKQQKYEQDIAYLQKQIQDVSNNKKPDTTTKTKGADNDDEKKALQEQLNALASQTDGYKKQLKGKTITAEISPKLSQIFVSDAQGWVMRDVLNELDLEGDDFTAPKITVKDSAGQVRWSKTKPNERMGLDEYIEELKTRFPSFVATNFKRGEGNNISGTTKAATSGVGLTIEDIQTMTDEDLRTLAMDPTKRKDLSKFLKFN